MKDEQEKLRFLISDLAYTVSTGWHAELTSEASCIHGMPFPGSLQEINQFIINVEFFNAA